MYTKPNQTTPNHSIITSNQTTNHDQIRPKNESQASNATSAKLYLVDYITLMAEGNFHSALLKDWFNYTTVCLINYEIHCHAMFLLRIMFINHVNLSGLGSLTVLFWISGFKIKK